MKKICTVILMALFLLSFSLIQGQVNFSLGLKAGSNFSNLSFDPNVPSNVTKSSLTGLEYGAIAELSFIPMLSLQIEPTYITGGCSLSGPVFADENNNIVNGKLTYNVSYLEFPILLKFKIPIPKSKISPFVFAGPNVAILLSAKEKDEPNGYPSSDIDSKDLISSINFSLDFGAGVSYKFNSTTSITLDGRYSLGLSNILSDKGKQSIGANTVVKTSGFQISGGVIFVL